MKDKLFVFILIFLLGAMTTHIFYQAIDKKLPEAFEINRGGKVVGYAETDSKFSEFVMLNDAKSPGMFIAFPIWGSQKEIQEALS